MSDTNAQVQVQDEEVAKYVEEKRVKEFIQDLMQAVLLEQPADPRKYLASYIRQRYLEAGAVPQQE